MKSQSRLSKILGAAAVAGLVLLAFSLGAFKVRNIDIPWHLKSGEWIVEHRAVPRVDFFSFTREGREWIDAQWLFQAAAFLVYQAAGERSLSALVAVTGAALVPLLIFSGRGIAPLGLRALAGLLFLLAINPRLQCRPELVTFLLMAAMLFCLERARAGRVRLLILVPFIQLLWVNAEGLWPIGLALVAAYVADLLIASLGRDGLSWRRGPWLLALAATLTASLAQPYGLAGFIFPLRLLAEVTLETTLHKRLIWEFQPLMSGPLAAGTLIPFFTLALAATSAAIGSGRRMRPALLGLGLAFLYLALEARRNVGVASVALAHLLLVQLEELARERPQWFGQARLAAGAAALALIGALVFSTLSQAVKVVTWNGTRREPGLGWSRAWCPLETTEFLRSIGYEGNIINNVDMGGFLIWAGWPRWKVFSDGRAEVGDEQTMALHHRVFTDAAEFRRVAHDYRVEAVVVRYWEQYLLDFSLLLGLHKSWAPVHIDEVGVVFLKRTPRWQPLIHEREIPYQELGRRMTEDWTGPP